VRWEDGGDVEIFLEDIELNGETLRRAQTALAEQYKPQTRGETDNNSVDGATSGAAEVEPEWDKEPFLTYTRRNTGAISTLTPLGQHSGVALPQVPNDNTLDNNGSLDIGSNHDSESEERGRGRGSCGGRGRRRGSSVSFRSRASAPGRGRGHGRGRERATDSLPVQSEIILEDSDTSEEDSEPEAESEPEEKPDPKSLS
jgi:hypothetical protein